MTQEQHDLMELSGCENWEQVVDTFGGMAVWKIKEEADRMWPDDDNADFAQRIFNALN